MGRFNGQFRRRALRQFETFGEGDRSGKEFSSLRFADLGLNAFEPNGRLRNGNRVGAVVLNHNRNRLFRRQRPDRK
jgi:hypothetical protein